MCYFLIFTQTLNYSALANEVNNVTDGLDIFWPIEIKLIQLTLNNKGIFDLSVIGIIMSIYKDKKKMIYTLAMCCGVIHTHNRRLIF